MDLSGRGRWWSIAACLLVGTALAAACTPGLRTAAVLGATGLAVVAPTVGVLRYRPAQPLPWVGASLMFACWAAGMTITALDPAAQVVGGYLVAGGAVLASALVLGLFLRRRHRSPGSVRTATSRTATARTPATRPERLGRRADQMVVSCIVGLGLAQMLATGLAAQEAGRDWVTAGASMDVVLACLLLRFAASRQNLQVCGWLTVGAALLTALNDALVTSGGQRIALPSSGLSVIWTAAACLYAVAAVHPSMASVFTPATLQSRRSESSRLLGLAPLALAPAGLYLIGGTGLGLRLPTTWYLVTAVLVSVLAVLRGAQAVLGSERRAHQDPLTGVANRRGLRTAFDQLLGGAPPAHDDDPDRLSAPGGRLLGRLCLLDVDDFKQVNDTFGHESGDQLLLTISRRLRTVVGSAGTVARSGGDEFIVLLPEHGVQPEELMTATFARPFELGTASAPHLRTIRASAGWTAVHGDTELGHALAEADIALYATKAQAKGTTTAFEPRLRSDVLGRLSLVEDLRGLLEGTTGSTAGRLEVHYQPLVSLADDQVVGCEALVRWHHPHRGRLAPDTFLPLAEQYGLAAQLDAWVLREALAQLPGWDAAGLPRLFVSVNLGLSSMLDPALADAVRRALVTAGVAADRLHLEITEHAELPATAGADALRSLAADGVQVSLDDFGIGYTSLDYLRRYPVSTVKLDRSITEPLQYESTSPLLSGVVLLAGSLGLDVLAEGIETQVQKDRLTALGAQFGQGYLLAHPLPAADFVACVQQQMPVPAAT